MLKYQLVVLGPAQNRFFKALKAEIEERIEDLGLDAASDLEILRARESDQIEWDATPVAVWFGSAETHEERDVALLGTLLEESAPVFPVVEALDGYRALVPEALHRINGAVWDRHRLASNVLAAFRLTRAQRRAFISYRRNDSRGVAAQLFDQLSRRGYLPFLDTASVESGVDFQDVLWARMADVDLLIFLDSPNALTSRWVYRELARAHDLGLGVLQIIWPDHHPTAGTELSQSVQLQWSDFKRRDGSADHGLKDEAVAEIVSEAERARIRSLGSRRRRVVADLVDQAARCGLKAVVHPVDPIELYREDAVAATATKVGAVIPFVGLPDAPAIQQQEEPLPAGDRMPVRIAYSGLGMDPVWTEHLQWLNQHLRLTTTQVDLIDGWLGAL